MECAWSHTARASRDFLEEVGLVGRWVGFSQAEVGQGKITRRCGKVRACSWGKLGLPRDAEAGIRHRGP